MIAQATHVATVPALVLHAAALLVLGTVWGLIRLSRRGGAVSRGAMWVLGTLLITVLALPILARLGQIDYGSNQAPSIIATHGSSSASMRSLPAQPHRTQTVPALTWHPASDILPDAAADLYPSRPAAEQALAAKIRSHSDAPLVLFPKAGTDRGHCQSLADALTRAGLRCHVQPPVTADGVQPYDLGEHRLTVETVAHNGNQGLGQITARSAPQQGARPLLATARFVNKPWLSDLAAYRIEHNVPDLLVATHSELQSTEAAARDIALQAAADLLAPRLAGRRGDMPAHPVRSMLIQALNNHWTPRDRFTQRLDRPYGPVYRTALLIDAGHEPLQQLAQTVNGWTSAPNTQHTQAFAPYANQSLPASPSPVAVTHQTYASILFRLLGLAALVGLTLLIYRVLDGWTKGYSQGPLIAVAVVVILLGALVLGWVVTVPRQVSPPASHPHGGLTL